ncbi:hypothetical protein Aduo_012611 [Ancylostoma duodenale]
MREAETGENIFLKLYSFRMAHKVELALSDAMMDRHDHAKQESKLYKWRVFTTKHLNQLRNFFGPTWSSRRRVHSQTAKLFDEGPFLQLKQIIDVCWTSSEKESIHNFVRIHKNLWLALQQISHEHSTFDKHTKLRAAGFFYVLKSLKFYRYVIYQLQLLDIVSTLSKSAQVKKS